MLNWIVWNRTDYLYKNGLNNLQKPTNQPNNFHEYFLLQSNALQL